MNKHATPPMFHEMRTPWTTMPEEITNNTTFLCSAITWSSVEVKAHQVQNKVLSEEKWLVWLKQKFTSIEQEKFSHFHRCGTVRMARKLGCHQVEKWCIETWNIEGPAHEK